MNFLLTIMQELNAEKWSLGHTETLSGDSEDGDNHVVSKTSDIVSER